MSASVARFPPGVRVRKRGEYARVFADARRFHAPAMTLHALPSETPRLGLAVSRKVDAHAVGRNRIKRVLRDAFRHARASLPPYDLVVVAKPAAAKLENAALRAAFLQLLQRLPALPLSTSTGTMPLEVGADLPISP